MIAASRPKDVTSSISRGPRWYRCNRREHHQTRLRVPPLEPLVSLCARSSPLFRNVLSTTIQLPHISTFNFYHLTTPHPAFRSTSPAESQLTMQHLTPLAKVKMSDETPQTTTTTPPTLGNIVDGVARMSTSPSVSRSSSQPGTPGGSAVVDNGTNLGSTMGRKASIPSQQKPFSMERRTSQPSSRRGSRRGSGVFTTPSGTQAVYHTRTHVSGMRGQEGES